MSVNWPKSKSFADRYWVQDLIPPAKELSALRAVFIGESPHRDEVSSENPLERSPFRGVAGREWWSELAKFMAKPIPMRPVPDRETLIDVCSELRIAVMNAVQYPIDPKIMMHQGSASEPRVQLGFEKSSSEFGYKAVQKQKGDRNPVEFAIDDLVKRLGRLKNADAQLVCLGHDSRWFVEQALDRFKGSEPLLARPLVTVPHPSSWWRNAAYRAKAVGVLESLLNSKKKRSGEKDLLTA